jgi:hypothetical protein
MLRVREKREFGFQTLIRSSFLDAIVELGRLCLQVLTFKSQRLGFLSKAAHFQPSFFDWVSSLGRFAGFCVAASSLYFGKHAALGFTNTL